MEVSEEDETRSESEATCMNSVLFHFDKWKTHNSATLQGLDFVIYVGVKSLQHSAWWKPQMKTSLCF